MKKAIMFCIALLLAAVPCFADDIVIWQNTFTSTAPSGVSYWVVDLTPKRIDDGYFTTSITSSITQGVAGSGTTLTFDYATTNKAISTAQVDGTSAFQKLDWQVGWAAMAVDSGNTNYAYTIEPEAAKYLVLRFTSGATNLTWTQEITAR